MSAPALTFESLPVGSWFTLLNDPEHRPLFKCGRDFINGQYKSTIPQPSEPVTPL